jgi:hypothetical protein
MQRDRVVRDTAALVPRCLRMIDGELVEVVVVRGDRRLAMVDHRAGHVMGVVVVVMRLMQRRQRFHPKNPREARDQRERAPAAPSSWSPHRWQLRRCPAPGSCLQIPTPEQSLTTRPS